MRTLQEFQAFAEGLGEHDVTLAAAVAELLRRVDDDGVAQRVDWIDGVGEALASLTGGSAAVTRASAALREGLTAELEGELIPRLERAGFAFRDPRNEGWERMCIAPQLWPELGPGREELLSQLQERVGALQETHRAAVHVSEALASVSGDSLLRAESLTKVYSRRKVVNDVKLSVRQGEIVGLLGPNGAGKTTTFYMIVGLIPPNEGRVFLDGAELTNVPMYKRARLGVGYLAQEPSIFRKLSVEDNVRAILETLKLPRQEERDRLEQLLDELSIAHLRRSKAYSLSGGERRRLEITRALVQRPRFMLLDEPFAGIDPIAVNDIQTIVSDLKDRGIGVIITDHNVEQTLEIVDRAYIMYEGRIRVSGTVSELVWNQEVAEIYLGPVLTQRMRKRFPSPPSSSNGAQGGHAIPPSADPEP